MITEHSIEIRVRYSETDAMGRVYHSNYINYFEIGRTEMFRSAGRSYRQMEESGLYFVISELACKYHLGAGYDDVLILNTKLGKVKGARVEHFYELYRGIDLLVEGRSVLACVDRLGKVCRLPSWIYPE